MDVIGFFDISFSRTSYRGLMIRFTVGIPWVSPKCLVLEVTEACKGHRHFMLVAKGDRILIFY